MKRFGDTLPRLKNWNYSWNGLYFITICVEGRVNHFGEVVDGKMILSEAGLVVDKIWRSIPLQFDYILLEEFVVMPDHFHGILKIQRSNIRHIECPMTKIEYPYNHSEFIKERGGVCGEKNPMLHQNISRVIRWFKGRSTFEIRKFNRAFSWQSRFYDHVIRDENAFQRITKYIKNNPSKYKKSD
ncbi:MAG: transposase [Crocinitomicaceae bacterium]|nr:transposase [Crocinitomicaceae bacterium]MBK8926630.1 transposase [Crocinitomicaceae bacterium]